MTIVLPLVSTAKDFTTYDAFLGDLGLMFYESGDRVTRSVSLEKDSVVAASNRHELTLESGALFAQGSFIGGMGQVHADLQTSDERKYLHSEGMDISKGTLRHIKSTTADTSRGGSHMVVASGQLLIGTGTSVKSASAVTGPWTTEDPNAGEAAQTVYSLTSTGTYAYAALISNGIHQRDNAGTWTHYNALNTRLLGWYKDRLIAAHHTDRGLYEVTSTTTPVTPFETLPVGWGATAIFDNGEFIYVIVNDENNPRTQVRHYGLNDAGSAIEAKGFTTIPTTEVLSTGVGYVGLVFLGGYKKLQDGTNVPVLYRATPTSTGHLELVKIYEGEGTGASQSISAMAAVGDSIVFGLSSNTNNPLLNRRDGIGRYNIATGAFTADLERTAPVAGQNYNPAAIQTFGGRICWVHSNAFVYENTTLKETAKFISSIADGGAPGVSKLFTKLRLRCKPMPNGGSIAVSYTLTHPEEGQWVLAGTYSTASGRGTTYDLADVISRSLAIKFETTAASTTQAPEIEGFDVSFYPVEENPDDAEIELIRTVRLVPRDRKDLRGSARYQNVRTVNEQIWDELHSQVVWYEPQGTYDLRIEDITEVIPQSPIYDATGGEATKESVVLQLRMRGTMR